MGIVETIICSAIHHDDGEEHMHQPKNIKTGFVIAGRRHHNCIATRFTLLKFWDGDRLKLGKETFGFLTSDDRFVGREEAGIIALATGQVKELKHFNGKELDSSDLFL